MDSFVISNVKNIRGESISVRVSGGKITHIGDIVTHQNEEIDGKGKMIIPGLVDMQVHLRDFKQAYKETVKTGTQAASRGGFTSIACMPNTQPCLDNLETLNDLKEKVSEEGYCKVFPIAAMTKDIQGETLVDYKTYKDAGVLAITDDGRGVQKDEVMREVFEEAKKYSLGLMQHCEVEAISKGASLHEGKKSKELGLVGQSGLAESEMVKRDIDLLREIGGHYHVLHMSAKESVEHVRKAKKEGLNVTCEVTPHHLLLCDEDIPNEDTHFKMNPPLRSREDMLCLNEALLDGTIDMITTDHAPHTPEEKAQGLDDAPFGIIGLETAFPLIYTYYVKNEKMSFEKLIDLMCIKPVEIFKVANGQLRVGDDADLCLVDIEQSKVVDAKEFYSKCENTPFDGDDLYGWPVLTICNGKITYKDSNYDF